MHRQRSLLAAAFLLSILLAGLHLLAMAYFLYWRFWWYDVVMHFLGGLTLGLFSYWIFFASGIFFKEAQSRALVIWFVFLSIFAIGVSWEIFEYTNGITDSHEGYALDTANDLILDSCGAVFAALLGTSLRKENHA